MSTAQTCRRYVDAPMGDGDATSMAPRHPKQLTISYDLHRAIEDLRSVPVLNWPDEVTFDDDITCDVVDRTERNASVSGDVVVQSELSNQTANTTTTMKVSEWSYTVQADGHNVACPSATVDGDLITTSSSLPLVGQPSWSVRTYIHASANGQSVEQQTFDGRNERESDNVFVDVATPIDADLLIDDVYEREMDELDQLDVEVITSEDPREWLLNLLPEPMATDGFDQRIRRHNCANSTDIQTNRLLIDSSTDRRLTHSKSYVTERSTSAKVRPQSVRANTSSPVPCRSTDVSSCVDTSAEELFEEIVESMRDTVSEDDAELDALTDAENQLAIDDTNTKSDHEKLETTVGYRNFVTEKIVDDIMTSPVQPLTRPSKRRARKNDKQDTLELKRQKDLTVSLASTLNECLDALARIDASDRRIDGVRHYQNSDVMYSSSSTKPSRTNSLGHRNVTSSSSGFQSDFLDVDIDEEFDANVIFDAADVDGLRLAAKTTSLDSLLEENDDDDDDDDRLYSNQTIIRRPIPSPSRRPDNHSIVNSSVEQTTTPQQTAVKTETYVTTTDRTEGLEHDKDARIDKENGTVVAYNEQSAKVEVLAEELITQEIVLNIILPRRSKKNMKRAGVDGRIDRSDSAETGVVDRMKNNKTPHRDFHIHRVVRCSDVADHSDNDLAVHEYPESKGQKSVVETKVAGEDGTVNEDDKQLESSSVVLPCQSLASRYVGGPLRVELERDTESAATERVDDDTRLRVTSRNRIKVLRAPGGSGAALYNAPVASISDVVDEVGRTLAGDHQRQTLPPGARVTCDAIEQKSSTSLPDNDVTVIRRTIVDDSDQH